MTIYSTQLAHATAAVLASIALAGCAGTGSGAGLSAGTGAGASVDTGSGGGVVAPGASKGLSNTADIIVQSLGGNVSTQGNALSTIGDALITSGDNGTIAGTGGVLRNTGKAVTAVGDGVSNGPGQTSDSNDILNPVITSLPVALQHAGRAASSGGNGINALGDNKALTVLKPVVGLIGEGLSSSGGIVSSVGERLEENVNSSQVRSVTSGGSRLIVPLIKTVMLTTDGLVAELGGGTGVDGVLKPLTSAVTGVGGATGVNGLLAPVTSAAAGVVSGATGATGAGGQIAPLTSSATGLVTGAGGTAGVGNILTPVTNLLSAVGGLPR